VLSVPNAQFQFEEEKLNSVVSISFLISYGDSHSERTTAALLAKSDLDPQYLLAFDFTQK
jgi:hypothetical protein